MHVVRSIHRHLAQVRLLHKRTANFISMKLKQRFLTVVFQFQYINSIFASSCAALYYVNYTHASILSLFQTMDHFYCSIIRFFSSCFPQSIWTTAYSILVPCLRTHEYTSINVMEFLLWLHEICFLFVCFFFLLLFFGYKKKLVPFPAKVLFIHSFIHSPCF